MQKITKRSRLHPLAFYLHAVKGKNQVPHLLLHDVNGVKQNPGKYSALVSDMIEYKSHLGFANSNNAQVYLHIERRSEIGQQVVTRDTGDAC